MAIFRGRPAPSDQHQNIPVKQSFIPKGLILRFSRKNTEHRQHVCVKEIQETANCTSFATIRQPDFLESKGRNFQVARQKEVACYQPHMLRSAQPPTSQEREKRECSRSGLTCRFFGESDRDPTWPNGVPSGFHLSPSKKRRDPLPQDTWVSHPDIQSKAPLLTPHKFIEGHSSRPRSRQGGEKKGTNKQKEANKNKRRTHGRGPRRRRGGRGSVRGHRRLAGRVDLRPVGRSLVVSRSR